jgi:Bacteriocin-protection, YdeI or OmpD-Associated/Domain of unknown function (DUF1905)
MAQPKTSFKTIVAGKIDTPTGIEVPPASIAELGSNKKPAVKVTVNGYSYPSTVAVMGGKFMIPLSAAHRAASGLKAGDKIAVTLELETEPRTVEIPADLLAALSKKTSIKAAFDALAPSKRKECVRQVVEAKAQETRERRIAKIVADLSGA